MRLCSTVIFTDKLAEVQTFYQTYYFEIPQDTSNPHAFSINPFAEAQITWIDAASANAPISQNTLIRVALPFPKLEREQMTARGVMCSELAIEDWGPFHGKAVQSFTVTDPSGTRIVYYEDHFGEDRRQLMTTGAGVPTRDVQKSEG